MSSPQGGTPNSKFANRLERLAEQHAPRIAARNEISAIPDWKENFRYPASLVGAAVLGMLGVFVARYVRFHMTGGTLAGDDADITMLIDGGIAAMCSFALFSMMRFKGAEYKAAQTVGIAIMVCVMHNMVHVAPKAFDVLFSPEWTRDVVAFTEPKSILFRGITFSLDTSSQAVAAGETPALPSIIRLQ